MAAATVSFAPSVPIKYSESVEVSFNGHLFYDGHLSFSHKNYSVSSSTFSKALPSMVLMSTMTCTLNLKRCSDKMNSLICRYQQ